MKKIKDTLGVEVQVGDVVRATAWGMRIRLHDIGKTATVTGFTSSGNVKHDNPDLASGKALYPSFLAVARRDGKPGHEGNA